VSANSNAYLDIGTAPAPATATATAVKTSDAKAHCDFWDKTPLPWPHV